MPLTDIPLGTLPIPIHFGENALRRLGELARDAGGTRALLVTDRGLCDAGHVGPAESSLRDAGLHTTVFNDVHENPTTDDVDACVEAARLAEADILIGFGGGSSMDAAKGCNFVLTNGGKIQDYWGVDKATQAMLPFIAVPTTSGTGSECQRFALISAKGSHQKMACGDPGAAARCAILDPLLTLTQPAFVTACTGVDAIVHAVETAVTRVATPASLRYAHEAFRLLVANIFTVLDAPDDLKARGAMQVGAALAGTAIEHSMLGAAHAAANPLTAGFDVIHGQAVCNTLPHIVRFNAQDPDVAERYRTLMEHAGDSYPSADAAVDALLAFLQSLSTKTGLASPLRELGAAESDLDRLSTEAAAQWTASFNPRKTEAADFRTIYAAAL